MGLTEIMPEVYCVYFFVFLRDKELVIQKVTELIEQGYLNYLVWGPFLENAG